MNKTNLKQNPKRNPENLKIKIKVKKEKQRLKIIILFKSIAMKSLKSIYSNI